MISGTKEPVADDRHVEEGSAARCRSALLARCWPAAGPLLGRCWAAAVLRCQFTMALTSGESWLSVPAEFTAVTVK
jgi:hypothetical protein